MQHVEVEVVVIYASIVVLTFEKPKKAITARRIPHMLLKQQLFSRDFFCSLAQKMVLRRIYP